VAAGTQRPQPARLDDPARPAEGEPGDVFLPADVRGQDQVEVEVEVVDGLLAL